VNIGQILVIALSALLGVWYFGGAWVNRKRGVATYYWLREGLQAVVGAIGEARWLGSASAGGRLAVPEAKAPFRTVEAIFTLEAREMLPWWLIQRLRGRRDSLIIRASLRHRPPLLLVTAQADQTAPEGYQAHDAPAGLRLFAADGVSAAQIRALQSFLETYATGLKTLSCEAKRPHLVLQIDLAALQANDQPAAAFFSALRDTCQALLGAEG